MSRESIEEKTENIPINKATNEISNSLFQCIYFLSCFFDNSGHFSLFLMHLGFDQIAFH